MAVSDAPHCHVRVGSLEAPRQGAALSELFHSFASQPRSVFVCGGEIKRNADLNVVLVGCCVRAPLRTLVSLFSVDFSLHNFTSGVSFP